MTELWLKSSLALPAFAAVPAEPQVCDLLARYPYIGYSSAEPPFQWEYVDRPEVGTSFLTFFHPPTRPTPPDGVRYLAATPLESSTITTHTMSVPTTVADPTQLTQVQVELECLTLIHGHLPPKSPSEAIPIGSEELKLSRFRKRFRIKTGAGHPGLWFVYFGQDENGGAGAGGTLVAPAGWEREPVRAYPLDVQSVPTDPVYVYGGRSRPPAPMGVLPGYIPPPASALPPTPAHNPLLNRPMSSNGGYAPVPSPVQRSTSRPLSQSGPPAPPPGPPFPPVPSPFVRHQQHLASLGVSPTGGNGDSGLPPLQPGTPSYLHLQQQQHASQQLAHHNAQAAYAAALSEQVGVTSSGMTSPLPIGGGAGGLGGTGMPPGISPSHALGPPSASGSAPPGIGGHAIPTQAQIQALQIRQQQQMQLEQVRLRAAAMRAGQNVPPMLVGNGNPNKGMHHAPLTGSLSSTSAVSITSSPVPLHAMIPPPPPHSHPHPQSHPQPHPQAYPHPPVIKDEPPSSCDIIDVLNQRSISISRFSRNHEFLADVFDPWTVRDILLRQKQQRDPREDMAEAEELERRRGTGKGKEREREKRGTEKLVELACATLAGPRESGRLSVEERREILEERLRNTEEEMNEMERKYQVALSGYGVKGKGKEGRAVEERVLI